MIGFEWLTPPRAVPDAQTLAAGIKAEAHRLGFDLAGITAVRASEHALYYRGWLAQGRHGEMSYLAREDAVSRRTQPHQAWPGLHSAIVVGLNYYADDDVALADERSVELDASHANDDETACGTIARYARGRDYHKVIKQKLLALLDYMEREVGRELPLARAYVDTGPVLERELAQRAGLGWFGRNTMLIHPRRGSYFFLGALLVELPLLADEPFVADHCGSCHACVSACPTGALLDREASGAPVIDATRCISYLTIEHRGPIPRELRPLIGNRIFGCDICQEVCPWNGPKFVQITSERSFEARSERRAPNSQTQIEQEGHGQREAHVPGTLAPSLIELMQMDETAWDEFTRGSALRRAKRAGFLRNVAVALGNARRGESVPVLAGALADDEPLVRGHAAWALGRVGGESAMGALRAALEVEADAWVRDELECAVHAAASHAPQA